MYDNNSRHPLFLDICQMSERIALSKRTIDVNIVQQRTPRIWKTSQDKKRTLQDMLSNIDGMEENIATYESIDIDDMNVVLAPAPYVADKIDMHLDKEWAEFYRLIGVANLIEQKKERMITDEVESNNEILQTLYMDCYIPRKYGSDCLNMAGLTNSIEVKDFNAGDNDDTEVTEY